MTSNDAVHIDPHRRSNRAPFTVLYEGDASSDPDSPPNGSGSSRNASRSPSPARRITGRTPSNHSASISSLIDGTTAPDNGNSPSRSLLAAFQAVSPRQAVSASSRGLSTSILGIGAGAAIASNMSMRGQQPASPIRSLSPSPRKLHTGQYQHRRNGSLGGSFASDAFRSLNGATPTPEHNGHSSPTRSCPPSPMATVTEGRSYDARSEDDCERMAWTIYKDPPAVGESSRSSQLEEDGQDNITEADMASVLATDEMDQHDEDQENRAPSAAVRSGDPHVASGDNGPSQLPSEMTAPSSTGRRRTATLMSRPPVLARHDSSIETLDPPSPLASTEVRTLRDARDRTPPAQILPCDPVRAAEVVAIAGLSLPSSSSRARFGGGLLAPEDEDADNAQRRKRLRT